MGLVLPILSEEEKEKMALDNAKIREELEALKKMRKEFPHLFAKESNL
ncbi:MAG: hypothetical protein J6M62_11330 [Selenomonadaceae bacterium]|nr:hypothetical protein [Selenomonadaceae bacterium]MBO6305646.1 hypothetical protein [Selenomonadaceae bacterium]